MKNIKKNIIFIVLFLAMAHSNSLWAGGDDKPEYAASLISKELLEGAKSVIREDFLFCDVKSEEKITKKVRQVITLFGAVEQYKKFRYYYRPKDEMTSLSLKIFDANGKFIRKIAKKEVLDEAVLDYSGYNDFRLKTAELMYGVFPYTIEIEYETQRKGILRYDTFFFQSLEEGTETSSVKFSMPTNLGLNYKTYNCKIEPNTRLEDGKKIYEWTAKMLKPIPREEAMPMISKVLPYVEITPISFKYDEYAGSMKDWASLGAFFYDLNLGRDNVSTGFANQITEMTAKAKTNYEKIDILYKYMQKNMRYVSIQLGIGGWQSFEATHVETNKYGDCKALSNFMKAMLKIVGIPSNMVFIEADKNPDFNPDPNFCAAHFNHAILYIPSEKMWLECTSNSLPTGYLSSFTQNRKALVLMGPASKLMTTPVYTAKDNHGSNKLEINIDENGAANIKRKTSLENILQDYYRAIAHREPLDAFKKEIQAKSPLSPFTFVNCDVDVKTDKPVVNYTYDINVERFSSKSGSRIFILLNKHNPFNSMPAANDQRKFAYSTGGEGYWVEDDVSINIPNNYEIESFPPNTTEYSSIYGTFSMKITKDKNKITYTRSLLINPVEVETTKYNELRDFYKKIQLADGYKVVLKKKTIEAVQKN